MKQTHPLTQIQKRIEACQSAVTAIERCADNNPGRDAIELLALAHRINRCSNPANYFIAKDAINFETGEEYDSTGTHWRCNSKMCSNCIAIFSRNNRRKLRNAIKKQELQNDERWYFPTFTIPNPNISLAATREIVNDAWSKFRKRLLCTSLIRGGAKSEEFTLTPNGYHYHLHLLLIAKYLNFDEVRRVWTECVIASWPKNIEPLQINTRDGYLWMKFQEITDIDRLPFELCKYITKSDSWTKMKQQDLTEVCLVRRWWRMFELFGCMAARETSEIANTSQDVVDHSIVHTKSLSDAASASISEQWRKKLDRMSLADYKEFLDREVWKAIRFRQQQIKARWPHATLFDGNGDEVKELPREPKGDSVLILATILHTNLDADDC